MTDTEYSIPNKIFKERDNHKKTTNKTITTSTKNNKKNQQNIL